MSHGHDADAKVSERPQTNNSSSDVPESGQ